MEGMKPDWLLKPLPQGKHLVEVGRVLSRLKLHTVCQSALCPNLGECFSRRTATFMVMGNICSRNCRFCAVEKGKPKPLEPSEPARIARAAKDLQLLHVVVTSVTRDDLPDGGANHFAQTIAAIREVDQNATVEVLIPDFGGSQEAVEVVVRAKPDIINHNLETVPRLYKKVRPKADYQRSIEILRSVKEMNRDIFTKSGMMLGLGESLEETLAVMKDLRHVDCDFLTLGQYLRPSEEHLPVARFIPPEEFQAIEAKGRGMGFRGIAAGPFVRSSYRAGELLKQGKECS
ncbi:MAG TPA: lipoyl synthase [Dehalococcoidia bacterium]|nr:lipoyl synthase [Dehalococcoidia bacterium]